MIVFIGLHILLGKTLLKGYLYTDIISCCVFPFSASRSFSSSLPALPCTSSHHPSFSILPPPTMCDMRYYSSPLQLKCHCYCVIPKRTNECHVTSGLLDLSLSWFSTASCNPFFFFSHRHVMSCHVMSSISSRDAVSSHLNAWLSRLRPILKLACSSGASRRIVNLARVLDSCTFIHTHSFLIDTSYVSLNILQH